MNWKAGKRKSFFYSARRFAHTAFFRYPMKLDTDSFGRISRSICTCSGILPLPRFSLLSIQIVAVISFQPLLVFLCKTLSGDISAHTLYDIYSSMLYALNSYCHSSSNVLLLVFQRGCQAALLSYQKEFLFLHHPLYPSFEPLASRVLFCIQ